MRKVAAIVLISLMSTFGFDCTRASLAENSIFSTANGDVKFKVETVVTGLEVPWGG